MLLLTACADLLHTVHTFIIKTPLRRLYMLGPELSGYGFWQGRAPADICATLGGNAAHFWMDHHEECSARIERQFESFYCATTTGIYVLLAASIVRLTLRLVTGYVWMRLVASRAEGALRPLLVELQQHKRKRSRRRLLREDAEVPQTPRPLRRRT